MTVISSTISPGSDAFKANRDGMLTLIDRMRALEERTRAASAAARDRFHKRGQLLPRERVALPLELALLLCRQFGANQSVEGELAAI